MAGGDAQTVTGVDWQIITRPPFPLLPHFILTTAPQGQRSSPFTDEETEAQKAKSSSPGRVARRWQGRDLSPEALFPFPSASLSSSPSWGSQAFIECPFGRGRAYLAAAASRVRGEPDQEGQHVLCRARQLQACFEPGLGILLAEVWFPHGLGWWLSARGPFGFGFQIYS